MLLLDMNSLLKLHLSTVGSRTLFPDLKLLLSVLPFPNRPAWHGRALRNVVQTITKPDHYVRVAATVS